MQYFIALVLAVLFLVVGLASIVIYTLYRRSQESRLFIRADECQVESEVQRLPLLAPDVETSGGGALPQVRSVISQSSAHSSVRDRYQTIVITTNNEFYSDSHIDGEISPHSSYAAPKSPFTRSIENSDLFSATFSDYRSMKSSEGSGSESDNHILIDIIPSNSNKSYNSFDEEAAVLIKQYTKASVDGIPEYNERQVSNGSSNGASVHVNNRVSIDVVETVLTKDHCLSSPIATDNEEEINDNAADNEPAMSDSKDAKANTSLSNLVTPNSDVFAQTTINAIATTTSSPSTNNNNITTNTPLTPLSPTPRSGFHELESSTPQQVLATTNSSALRLTNLSMTSVPSMDNFTNYISVNTTVTPTTPRFNSDDKVPKDQLFEKNQYDSQKFDVVETTCKKVDPLSNVKQVDQDTACIKITARSDSEETVINSAVLPKGSLPQVVATTTTRATKGGDKNATVTITPSRSNKSNKRGNKLSRCHKWPRCTNGNCRFKHPEQICKFYPDCNFSDNVKNNTNNHSYYRQGFSTIANSNNNNGNRNKTRCFCLHPEDLHLLRKTIDRAGKEIKVRDLRKNVNCDSIDDAKSKFDEILNQAMNLDGWRVHVNPNMLFNKDANSCVMPISTVTTCKSIPTSYAVNQQLPSLMSIPSQQPQQPQQQQQHTYQYYQPNNYIYPVNYTLGHHLHNHQQDYLFNPQNDVRTQQHQIPSHLLPHPNQHPHIN